MYLLYGMNWIFVYISGLRLPLKGYKKVEIGYGVLYFQKVCCPSCLYAATVSLMLQR